MQDHFLLLQVLGFHQLQSSSLLILACKRNLTLLVSLHLYNVRAQVDPFHYLPMQQVRNYQKAKLNFDLQLQESICILQ